MSNDETVEKALEEERKLRKRWTEAADQLENVIRENEEIRQIYKQREEKEAREISELEQQIKELRQMILAQNDTAGLTLASAVASARVATEATTVIESQQQDQKLFNQEKENVQHILHQELNQSQKSDQAQENVKENDERGKEIKKVDAVRWENPARIGQMEPKAVPEASKTVSVTGVTVAAILTFKTVEKQATVKRENDQKLKSMHRDVQSRIGVTRFIHSSRQ